MNVLIVEDEKRLARALDEILSNQKYRVETVYNGDDGLYYASTGQYDIIILDVMIPGISGLEVAQRLRTKGISTPIIMLTAKSELSDKIKGLDCGADDYLTKPFEPDELLARMRALLRRPGEIVGEELTFADLRLDLTGSMLYSGPRSVRLRNKECEVLKILMHSHPALTPKETLIVKVWGVNSDADDNNVEAYVSFLRKKLFFLGSEVEIQSMRKLGYVLKEREV